MYALDRGSSRSSKSDDAVVVVRFDIVFGYESVVMKCEVLRHAKRQYAVSVAVTGMAPFRWEHCGWNAKDALFKHLR